ncbi:hypothetical protein CROQUDRAFT_703865 [Cronartium quercuum f. sp. fusiforme G11]|uniref:Uncharacterized protein n=1 Tax=Cronartium quercuum f. sp. fusiforme G11 TaxID=708437 RepID=A0A9P6NXW3_9BASI|nr:hypothetical protein CROQUDRAFT_703865 [Cronartium quercuum f. sp. fusiforme G11]
MDSTLLSTGAPQSTGPMSNPTQPPTSPKSLNSNLAIPETSSSSTDTDTSVNSTPLSESTTHSLPTHRVHTIVAGISLAICMLLLLALFLLYGRYRNLKNSYEANQTGPKLTGRAESSSTFSQIGNAIVGRWKYNEKEREPAVMARNKVPFQIKTEAQSSHSRRTSSPHPYLHSYHHTEEHSSPSESSASSFDGISPLDATFLFANSIGRQNSTFPNSTQTDLSTFSQQRVSSEVYQKTYNVRHTNELENYQLQPIPKLPDLRCLPSNTLQDLEMFVSQVEHELSTLI